MPKPMVHRLRLHVGLSALFVPVVLATGLGIAISSYQRTTTLLLEANSRLVESITRSATLEMQQFLAIKDIELNLKELEDLSVQPNLAKRLAYAPALRAAIDQTELVTSYSIGYPNGDRFQMRFLWDDVDRTLFRAPASAQYAIQSNEKSAGVTGSKVLLFDRNLKLIRTTFEPQFAAYDPRSRPWYRQAIGTNQPIVTEVYTFATTGRAGVTLARRTAKGQAVVGADMRLSSLSAQLKNRKVTPGTKLALITAKGTVHALDKPSFLSRSGDQLRSGSLVPKLGDVDVPVLNTVGDHLAPSLAALRQNAKVFE
jgi:hypothetical protein